jgi:hypothetical protein
MIDSHRVIVSGGYLGDGKKDDYTQKSWIYDLRYLESISHAPTSIRLESVTSTTFLESQLLGDGLRSGGCSGSDLPTH